MAIYQTPYCVGYAFVPWQQLDNVYTPEKALASGTAFPELNLNINEYGKICKEVNMNG